MYQHTAGFLSRNLRKGRFTPKHGLGKGEHHVQNVLPLLSAAGANMLLMAPQT